MYTGVVNSSLSFVGAEDEKARGVVRVAGCAGECVGVLRVYHGRAGPRVVVEFADALFAQVAVHHHTHGAALQRAEEGGGEIGDIGKGDQDALFGAHPHGLERVGETVGARLQAGVGDGPVPCAQRDPFAQPLPDPVVEKVVGDVEGVGWMEGHGGGDGGVTGGFRPRKCGAGKDYL